MDIPQMIRFHRKKAGLSRIELARLAGVGKTLVFDVEHGRLTIGFENLLKILHVLNIKLKFTSPFMTEFEESHES